MNFKIVLETMSMNPTTNVITNVATNTITVDCCNCVQFGQVTFSISSL